MFFIAEYYIRPNHSREQRADFGQFNEAENLSKQIWEAELQLTDRYYLRVRQRGAQCAKARLLPLRKSGFRFADS